MHDLQAVKQPWSRLLSHFPSIRAHQSTLLSCYHGTINGIPATLFTATAYLHGNREWPYTFLVIQFELIQAKKLPHFLIRPLTLYSGRRTWRESFLGKGTYLPPRWLKQQSPEFVREMALHTKDAEAIKLTLKPRIIDKIMSLPSRKQAWIESADNELIYSYMLNPTERSKFSPIMFDIRQILQAIDDAVDLYRALAYKQI